MDGRARVLIVGAGIAGLTLALLLARQGRRVVLVELADGLRTGGQTVDLRGGSAEVLADLGLLPTCIAACVPQHGIAWVDAAGGRRAAMPVEAFGGRGFVSERELLRSDLARILLEACGDDVEVRFGDTVDALDADGDAVRARFASGGAERFDLVVGADGTHSRVRALVLGPETAYRHPLGLAHAWYTLAETPRTPPVDGWFLVHNAPGARVVEARPGRPGEQEIGFSFPAADLPPRADREARTALLEAAFRGVGWRSPELLAAARTAPDLAMDTFDQIRTDRWHEGRVVLLGDAAWCASPLSGLGTALALLGARALAQALAAHGGTEDALVAFERRMRPTARSAQKLLPGRVRTYAPRTAGGIARTLAVYRLAQARPVAAALDRVPGYRGH